MSRQTKPPKARKGTKALYKCADGPFIGHTFALSSDFTMVFAIAVRGAQWRGRYAVTTSKRLQWQDVPVGAESSALRTLQVAS